MRKTGINDKMVFFVRRYPEKEIGSYFEYRVDKEVCNPTEDFKFYQKIGGVTYLPKAPVPGKKISSSAERVKDSEYFGSYIYYGQTDRQIRCILYARRKWLPDNKLIGVPSCLHSVIPRFDGTLQDVVITGMKIYDSRSSERKWSRFDTIIKAHHKGFYEIRSDDNLPQVARDMPFSRFRPNGFRTGIYIGCNTSLLMVDIGRAHLFNDYSRNFVYTLFQEGAFICTTTPFTFCLYDEEEGEEYSAERLKLQKKDRFKDSPNIERLWSGLNESKILFLKSAPNFTFWTLRANKCRRDLNLESMLCIPNGGQFEDVYEWDEGLVEVMRRQSLKPWSKYIEMAASPEPHLQDIDLDINQAYPQMDQK